MAEEQTTEEAPKKKSKVKLIIILIILLLLIGGGIVTYWWLNLRDPAGSIITEPTVQEETVEETTTPSQAKPETTSTTQTTTTQKTQQKTNKTTLNIVTIPTVTINLADKDTIRYLKIGFDIELSTKDSAESIEAQKAKVRDSVIILLSSKTYADLATTEGKILVKNEIASRLNQILGVPRVVQIYFNEFVIN